jgi:hypothetical protein
MTADSQPKALEAGSTGVAEEQTIRQAGLTIITVGSHAWGAGMAREDQLVFRRYNGSVKSMGHHASGTQCPAKRTRPKWKQYRFKIEIAEAGNVFTLELDVMTEAGLVGVQEDVLVTEGGCEVRSSFRRELMPV